MQPELTPVEIVGCEVDEAGRPLGLDNGQFTNYGGMYECKESKAIW